MNTYSFSDCFVGQTEEFTITIKEEMLASFYSLTGDNNPLHRDKTFANEYGYENRVVYGMLSASFLSTLAGVYLPGKYSLIHTVEVHFAKAVFPGETLTVSGVISGINESTRTIDLKVRIQNDLKKTVLRGKMRIGFLNG